VEFTSTPAKSRLLFAGNAILEGIREKNKKWTWQYFAQRRDDRNAYVDLFQKKQLSPLVGPVSSSQGHSSVNVDDFIGPATL